MRVVNWVGTAILVTAGVVAGGAGPATAAGVVPDQFVAKMYSEVLGRGPDPSGWTFHRDYFAGAGCSAATVRDKLLQVFASGEFAGIGYDTAETALVSYRAVLNREPRQDEVDAATAQLDGGATAGQLAGRLAGTPEFATLADRICSPATPGYGFDDSRAPAALRATGSGFAGSAEELQQRLDATPAGGTVALARHTVVRLTRPLYVPDGVTLTSAGLPNPRAYAAMARLSREPGWSGASVQLAPGARLDGVWVSGSRGRESGWDRERVSVLMLGGAHTAVTGSRLSEPSGASSLRVAGAADGRPCAGNLIENNLITSYTAEFTTIRQSDGISVGCEDTLVRGNAVIDATDVGIVVFTVSASVAQASRVTGNTVLHAGINAQGSMAVDGLFTAAGDPPNTASRRFTGGSVDHNTLWTSPRVAVQIALSVGGRPWYGANGTTFRGGRVEANTSAGLPVRAATGIAVSGALDVVVSDNTLATSLTPHASPCPSAALGASVGNGYASGVLDGYADALYYGCISFPTAG